ncbi:hypothetical protein [Lentzea sp. NBRC 102530]|uniref:hypothetical protein n=1 Tax=Lentzea sp. NBRC 102530 TaxID=3032201 RepID=UPI0024A2C204|nr:hypothetical protein [Lentzea sp. NBRC 102530]GLY55273.1 hypothetical protein Lesp01_89280 [Lentzea sp. NBRC 102530]
MTDSWELNLALLVAFLGALVALGYALIRRGRRKAERARRAELSEFAASVGGTLVDEGGDVRPWSADLERAMDDEYGTLVKWLGRASGANFNYALDFSRNGWHVRVTEASMEIVSSVGTNTTYETRIEVATADLVALKITQVYGGGLGSRWAGEMPVSVEREDRPLWMPLRLPLSISHAFVAYASDLSAAADFFNEDVVEWLLRQTRQHELPNLCIEAGVAYCVVDGPILPQFVVRKVDAIVDLLSLVPGSHRDVAV